jgi:DNA repair protein SbcD/Mre11
LIQLCIDEKASALLLSGDVFDRDWVDYNTGLFFVKELMRLREAETSVLVIRGNHDAKNVITKSLKLPPHVFEFPWEAASTQIVQGIAVHGQSFGEGSVPHDLSLKYPAPVSGCINIGMLHTSLDGRPGHDPYAPTRASVLQDKGYDYWALGHVHTREVIAQSPYIVYPGNLQGRHARETGAKGATVIEFDGAHRITGVRDVALDVLRWSVLDVVLTEGALLDDALASAQTAISQICALDPKRIQALRFRFRGAATDVQHLQKHEEKFAQELRSLAIQTGDVWVEKVLLEKNESAQAEPETEGAADGFRLYLRSADALKDAQGLLNDFRAELPLAVREELEGDELAAQACSHLLGELSVEGP